MNKSGPFQGLVGVRKNGRTGCHAVPLRAGRCWEVGGAMEKFIETSERHWRETG